MIFFNDLLKTESQEVLLTHKTYCQNQTPEDKHVRCVIYV